MKLPLTSAVVAALLLAAPALPAGQAAAGARFRPPRDCDSGTIIFRDGPVRLLRIAGTFDGEQASRHYVCSARLRTPKRFNQTSPGTDEQLSAFRRGGPRVAFVDTLAGGESFDQLLGTVDLRSGRRRLTGLRSRDEGPTVLAVVPDRDGGVAYLQDRFDDGAQRIGYAPARPDGGLGVPRPRVQITGSRVVPGSLGISAGTITWSTRTGERGARRVRPRFLKGPPAMLAAHRSPHGGTTMIDLAVISAIVARDRVAGHFAGPAATPRNLARRSLVQALGDRR